LEEYRIYNELTEGREAEYKEAASKKYYNVLRDIPQLTRYGKFIGEDVERMYAFERAEYVDIINDLIKAEGKAKEEAQKEAQSKAKKGSKGKKGKKKR